MRRVVLTVALVAPLVGLAPSAVDAQTPRASIGGFGGLTFGDVAGDTTFGGSLSVALTPNIHLIGEAGRLANLTPEPIDLLLDLTPVDVRRTAFYGEGGVRLLTSARAPVRGYVEATAGAARLRTRLATPSATVDRVTDVALRFFDRTEPMLGVGGGVLVHAGPVYVDLGYRYKRLMGNDPIGSLLSGGGAVAINQVRAGVGFRF